MEESRCKNVEVKVGPSTLENFGNTISAQSSEIVNQVFSNPLLIDKIVTYSMHKSNGKDIDRQTFASIRLVNTTWLQSASRALEKLEKPLILIRFGSKPSESILNNQIFDIKKGNILQHFALTFSKNCRSSKSVFPIALFLIPQCFLGENESLARFLEQFSDNVLFLFVNYPAKRATLNLRCGHISFNRLRTLFFMFGPEQGDAIELTAKDCKNGLTLCQEVLKNSSKLNTFILIGSSKSSADISAWSFPASIESIHLDCELTSQNLTFMRSNKNLPNLKILELDVYKQSEVDVIFQVLEHFGSQLKTLNLRVTSKITELLPLIRFPLMEKLTKFQISGPHFEFAPELEHVWPKLVPNLTCLVLENIEEYLFFDLVQGTRFENVENLELSLNVSPNESVLKEILISFPKIQELTLKFSINEVSGLKFLFGNYTRLKKLGLDFDLGVVDDSFNYKLVSCILGISFELSKQIVDNKEGNHIVPMDNPEAIMNLKELRTVTLRSRKVDSSGTSVILHGADIIFMHGLKKMPSLQEIKVEDRFGNLRLYKATT